MDATHSLPVYIQHDPWLVALSVVMAALGGYVGLGLAAKIQNATEMRRRWLLAGASWSVALGIWTMHFVGMLAAKLPPSVLYQVLPTLLSFLMCVLVVGIGIFLASAEQARGLRISLAGLFMGAGIVTMHYLGISALSGAFSIHHDHMLMAASAAIAIATSTGALTLFALDHRPIPLAFSAVLFGLAVSGMHYTAMAGMALVPGAAGEQILGPAVTGASLAIVVAVVGFVVSGGFLLFLVPDRTARELSSHAVSDHGHTDASAPADDEPASGGAASPAPAAGVPVESDGVKRLLPVDAVRAVQANAHYTLVLDGQREHLSPWSITEAEARLGPRRFMRVHRSFLVSLDHVRSLKKSGDGGVIEVENLGRRAIPVSRSHYAALKARLGLPVRSKPPASAHH